MKYIPEFVDNARAFVRLDHSSYDLMHAHYYQSGLVAKKVLELATVPFVMSFHTLALMKNLVARDTLEHESQFRIRTEFDLMRWAQAIVASSENDKEYMEYLYDAPPPKIHVVYPGIDAALFHPMEKSAARAHIGASREHKIVLFVGRVEPLKGIDTLLYAMKILKKKSPGQMVCLWIVGGDTSEPTAKWSKTLKELSVIRETLGIPPESVHFVGRQQQGALPYYYNAADVVVMPSHYESFGMAALEAMGCGIPVITTNVAGITSRLDAKHVSHITSVNNPLLLASQIGHVLDEPEHAKDLADQARRSVLALTWGNTAEKMLTVYTSVT